MTITIHAKDKAFKAFDEHRAALQVQGVEHELAVRESFKGLLESLSRAARWTLVVEQSFALGGGKYVRPDGTLYDDLRWPRGYWEAKDAADDLDLEIDRKIARGYPINNMIFADTRRAVLYQNKTRVGEFKLDDSNDLARLFTLFLNHEEPEIAEFEKAVERFKEDTPRLAESLKEILDEAHRANKRFQSAYDAFYELAARSLNPNISRDAVDEMLIQHLLTERLMRTVFQMGDFRERNPIAAEVEKVIRALTSASFSRDEFLARLDYFYTAIENAARDLPDWREKQAFINTIYERFFQGYAVKVADTHGIVYTPQPIVDFMSAAVEEVLLNEFGQHLWDEDVCIIDPATGTGNFIVNLMRRIARENPAHLPDAYAKRLFANEVMLLPYYIASLNIEHEYRDLTGQYSPFEGLCFVDTLGLAEGLQMQLAFMSEENTERVQRQKDAPITVIIGNPPYNANQQNENDNNKNRKYAVVDKQVRDTYARDSAASNKNALYDPYVKFFRWATDRLGDRDGIVCYVSNNGFFDGIAFDGMRRHLYEDFNRIYHLDLGGNMRKKGGNDSGVGNVFDIRVGVGITVAVKSAQYRDHRLFYKRVPDFWRKEEKLGYLAEMVREDGVQNALNTVDWLELTPDIKHTWNVPENADEFASFMPIGSKDAKQGMAGAAGTIFEIYGRGVATSRDDIVYNFNRPDLIRTVKSQVEAYNTEVDRYKRAGKPKDVDNFVLYDIVKWSESLKSNLVRGNYADFKEGKVRFSLYRPYCKQFLFFDRMLNERVYVFPSFFPSFKSEQENTTLIVGGYGRKAFAVVVANSISDLNFYVDPAQCFPFYVYDEDGSNRRENITDWALAQFQSHYNDPTITKWDIFYYVYAMLHHPVYRSRYAASLKRELPRIPFAAFSSSFPLPEDVGAQHAAPSGSGGGDIPSPFHHLARIGKSLADLHVGYESAKPYPLQEIWKAGKGLDTRVTKMKLSKDRAAIEYNAALTLTGIPAQAFEYRLGSRSALDWIIDQYQFKTDARTGITSDPNAYSDDPRYIIELIKRVVTVSIETVALVGQLQGVEWR